MLSALAGVTALAWIYLVVMARGMDDMSGMAMAGVRPWSALDFALIDPEPAFESPPASVQFDSYDPEAGIATGSVDETTTFSVQCER